MIGNFDNILNVGGAAFEKYVQGVSVKTKEKLTEQNINFSKNSHNEENHKATPPGIFELTNPNSNTWNVNLERGHGNVQNQDLDRNISPIPSVFEVLDEGRVEYARLAQDKNDITAGGNNRGNRYWQALPRKSAL